MKTVSLLLCLVALGTGAVGLWPPASGPSEPAQATEPSYLTGDSASETVWAKALFEAVRQGDSAESADQVRHLFVEALEHADQRAPIYLSLARHAAGEWCAFPSLDLLRRELDRRAGNLSPRLDQVAAKTAPTDLLTLYLMESLRSDLEQFRQANGPDDEVNAVAALFTDSADCRLLCLEAAAAEDPSCTAAWLELALRSEDPQRRRDAISAWESVEPDNAAPHYLRAWVCQLQGDRTGCLEALQAGNVHPRCTFPSALKPQRFQMTYPDDASLPEAAGQPVTTAAFGNLLFLHDLADASPSASALLHALAATLANDAATQSQTPTESIGWLLRGLGTHLIGGADADAEQVRHGLGILQLGAAIDQSVDERSALSQYDFHWQRSTRELSAGLLQWQARANRLLEDRTAILKGRIDLSAEERTAMQALVTQPRLQAGLMAESAAMQ